MADVVDGKMTDEVKVLRWEHVLDEIAARRVFHAYSNRMMTSSADSDSSFDDDDEVEVAAPVALPTRRVLELVKVVSQKVFDVIRLKLARVEEELLPDDPVPAKQEIRKSVRDIAQAFEAKDPPLCRSLLGFEAAKRLELTEIRLREKHNEEQMRTHRCLTPAPAVPKVGGASLADETDRFFAKHAKKNATPQLDAQEAASPACTTSMPVVILTYAFAMGALAVWERILAVAALHDGF